MKPVQLDCSFPELEERILAYWRTQDVFQRSMNPNREHAGKTGKRPTYIFYDGPPFATGLPHYGHLLAGTIKDVIGRFFTMKGYHVDRRFGWDCHGVPVEFEIQKTLNLHGAKAIRTYGVGRFNEECRKIVLRYTQEWEKFVDRSGRWVDFGRQYRTMDKDFMESVWWAVKALWDRGLIYEGVKSVPYSWAINTPLSNFEANLNYKTVQDPSVTVRAIFKTEARKKLKLEAAPAVPIVAYVWTTTAWTLPSNMAIAVNNDIPYSLVYDAAHKEIAVLAQNRLAEYFPGLVEQSEDEHGNQRLSEILGAELVGLEYEQFFNYFESSRAQGAFKVYAGDFVTADDGTGLVHLASYGEDDVVVFQKHNIPFADPVDEDGNFTAEVPELMGMNIKAAEPAVIKLLKDSGKLVWHKTITHSYPFCWRTDTPLMFKAISSWFVKVESFRDELVQMNKLIHWVPEHLREGRFGNWLEGARDWAISRNRFWGTPIPIWRCEKCRDITCIGGAAELEKLSGTKVEDLHSHFIDQLTFPCEKCSATKKRVPEVLDCWFESGAMPYGQAHYPFEGAEKFEKNFPADFIAEGLDQTRGWFYTLLVLSTALFGRPAFKNVVVNGTVLAEDGKKMSKSLRNYPPPEEVMNEIGADAMRLSMLASPAMRADDIRFSKSNVKQTVRQTLLPLWNSYNFFVTYALVDRWTPEQIPSGASPNLLDRWILSKLGSLVSGVDKAFSTYHLYAAAQPILDFVDQLTNWYIRLNRRRFWQGDSAAEQDDKAHAYATLYRVLITFVRTLSPLAPFISEEIYLNLKGTERDGDSVHLNSFPTLEELRGIEIDSDLEHAMEMFEEVILLGRGVRNDKNLKVRQPLATLTVIHPSAATLEQLKLLETYICEELNVKRVVYSTDEEKFVSLKALLNTKKLGGTLGPKLGSDGMKKLRGEVEGLSTAEIRKLESGQSLQLAGVEIAGDDVLIKRQTKGGDDAAASSGMITILLDTHVTQALQLEGLAREFVNRVQKMRKDLNFEVSDRIAIRYMTACQHLQTALSEHEDYVRRETLAVDLEAVRSEAELSGAINGEPEAHEIGDKSVIIGLMRLQG